MIHNGICPACNKPTLIEARIRFKSGQAVLDPKGHQIKTKCGACQKFIGYRPVNSQETAQPSIV